MVIFNSYVKLPEGTEQHALLFLVIVAARGLYAATGCRNLYGGSLNSAIFRCQVSEEIMETQFIRFQITSDNFR